MKQRALAFCTAVLLLCATAALAADAPETRVFDYAGLMTAEDAETLQAAIIDFQENTGYDFAVLTTNEDLQTTDYQQLADDFYVDHALGLGMNQTAVLCYLDLYGEGYYYVSVYGDLKNLMVTEDIQYLADQGMESFTQGDFLGGFTWTINLLTEALIHIGSVNQSVRVYDFAELLTQEETAALEAAIAEFRALSGRDFLYLSTNDNLIGNENGDYMEEFYAKHGFGEGDNRSGVMIYLDLQGGSYYVQNFGDVDELVSEDAVAAIITDANGPMGEGRVLDAVLGVIQAYTAYFQ